MTQTFQEKVVDYQRLLAEAKNIVERLDRKDLRRLINHYNRMFQHRETAKEIKT